ncbi:C4-dicarboxylate ABC transporter permease [Rhabdochromatium marinum]|nr:C4-dicarboxylate ABC transporter permease [Rhabdochromatium marinum]
MIRILNQLEETIIALLLVSMTLLVFFEVILRFVFNTGLTWGQEATLYLSAWFVLFGVSYGLKVGAHIGVDAFVRLLPPLAQRLLSIVAVILALIYCGLFIDGGWVYLSKMHKIGIELKDIPLPIWLADSILIIGLGLLSLRLLILLWRLVRGQARGFGFHDEAEESLHLMAELNEPEPEPASKPGPDSTPPARAGLSSQGGARA